MCDSKAMAFSSLTMGNMTFLKDASAGFTSATMVSCTLRDRSISRFVALMTDVVVSVNRGGAWGGFLKDCGAIASVASGLKAVEAGVGWMDGLKTRGRMCRLWTRPS